MNAKQITELNAAAYTLIGMNDRGLSVVPIEDDRMEPTLRRGDYVLVDPKVTRFMGEGLYVLDCNGQLRTLSILKSLPTSRRKQKQCRHLQFYFLGTMVDRSNGIGGSLFTHRGILSGTHAHLEATGQHLCAPKPH